MKPLPAPHVPGKTEFERFDNAVRQVLTVSKEELLRREAQEKQAKETDKLDHKPGCQSGSQISIRSRQIMPQERRSVYYQSRVRMRRGST